LKDPEQLRADLDAMIELERNSTGSDPGKETKLWADKLAEVDRKRARYQEMAADDLITFDELRSRLSELNNTRAIAERELEALRNREGRIAELEKKRDSLLASLMSTAPEALDALNAEDRAAQRVFVDVADLEVLEEPSSPALFYGHQFPPWVLVTTKLILSSSPGRRPGTLMPPSRSAFTFALAAGQSLTNVSQFARLLGL
jgi:hypothetical protein